MTALAITLCVASYTITVFILGYFVGGRTRRIKQEVTGYVIYRVEREKEEDPADWWKKGEDE